jgi:hypothetical protein
MLENEARQVSPAIVHSLVPAAEIAPPKQSRARLPNGAATTESFTRLDDFKSHPVRFCSLGGGLAGVTLVNKGGAECSLDFSKRSASFTKKEELSYPSLVPHRGARDHAHFAACLTLNHRAYPVFHNEPGARRRGADSAKTTV